jgi:hypothetical protein
LRESYSPEGPEEALTTTNYAPPVDIYEDEHNITLKLEVPGIDEKDIDVRIENTTLTVHGERKAEVLPRYPPKTQRIVKEHEASWGDHCAVAGVSWRSRERMAGRIAELLNQVANMGRRG